MATAGRNKNKEKEMKTDVNVQEYKKLKNRIMNLTGQPARVVLMCILEGKNLDEALSIGETYPPGA
jgi:hypothetical protein